MKAPVILVLPIPLGGGKGMHVLVKLSEINPVREGARLLRLCDLTYEDQVTHAIRLVPAMASTLRVIVDVEPEQVYVVIKARPSWVNHIPEFLNAGWCQPSDPVPTWVLP